MSQRERERERERELKMREADERSLIAFGELPDGVVCLSNQHSKRQERLQAQSICEMLAWMIRIAFE